MKCVRFFRWLEENVPLYYARTVEVVGPYLVLLWAKLIQLKDYLLLVSQPIRAWLYARGVEAAVWVSSLMANFH